MAKNSNILGVINDMKEKYGQSVPQAKEAGTVKRLVMSSPKLNHIFSGGYPIGRITEMYGSESSGKSVLSYYIGGQFQQRTDNDQRTVVYVDMEHAFDFKYATTVGLNCNENFVLVQPLNGEEGFTIVDSLVKTGEVGFIVWDSTTTTPTAAAMEDEFGKRCVGPDTEVNFRMMPLL